MSAPVQDGPATRSAAPMPVPRSGRILAALAIFFALAVQVQATLPLGDSAVRFNLADLLAAPLALWALSHMIRHRREALRGLTIPVLTALAAVTLAFTIALIIGAANGGLTPWAAVKFVGWFALVAYVVASFGLGRFGGSVIRGLTVHALVFGLAALAFVQLLSLVFGLGLFPGQVSRFWGFTGNPNAAALMFLAGFVLCFTLFARERNGWRVVVLVAAAALNLSGIVLTGSVAAFATLPLVIIAMMALRVSWRRLGVVFAVAVLFLLPTRISWDGEGLRFYYDASHLSLGATESKIGSLLQDEHGESLVYEVTIGARIDSIERGLAEWRQAPLFGIGLGSHIRDAQLRQDTKYPGMQIHNTAVWLLAETGLAGFLAVGALLFALVRALALRAGENGGRWRLDGSLPLAAIVILGATLVMSMAHEFMYQRIVWAVLGLALGTAPPRAGLRSGRLFLSTGLSQSGRNRL